MSVDLLSLLLLVTDDGLEKTIQMLICRVILLLECIETAGEVCAETRCVVVFER